MKLLTMLFSICLVSFITSQCVSSRPKHNWRLNFHDAKNALVIIDGKVFKGDVTDIDPSIVGSIEVIHKEQLQNGVILINTKKQKR